MAQLSQSKPKMTIEEFLLQRFVPQPATPVFSHAIRAYPQLRKFAKESAHPRAEPEDLNVDILRLQQLSIQMLAVNGKQVVFGNA